MNSQTTSRQEIEIKLNLGSFANYLKLMGFLGQIDEEQKQVNAFFDTPDGKLHKKGWALRVRTENDTGRVTLKGTEAGDGDAAIRDEIESKISHSKAEQIIRGDADVLELDHDPIERVRDIVGKDELKPLVVFENTRQRKSMRLEDYEYVFEVDTTSFPDGSVDYELEMELPDANRIEHVNDRLRKIFSSLDIPFERESESKLARALKRSAK